MRYLLDTHVWIWSQESPERLGPKTQRALNDLTQERFVSSISSLEIARLMEAERLRFKHPFLQWKDVSLARLHAPTFALTHEIAWEAYQLPGRFHSDPADRVLVATARLENLTLLTADDSILRYPHVRTFRASA